MWIQLRANKSIEERGELNHYHAGDFVNVGKQMALLWISQGEAVIPGTNYLAELGMTAGSGAHIIGLEADDEQHPARVNFAEYTQGNSGFDISVGSEYIVPFNKTLIWDPSTPLRKELIPVGLSLLDTWEIAVPLASYDDLACHVGDKDEQEYTAKIVHDLRMPLYHTGLIYARRCKETARLFEAWENERRNGKHIGLAFLRALYKTPLLILALPVSWHEVNK